MWTHLFAKAVEQSLDVFGMILRVGAPYSVVYNDRLVEMRVPDLGVLEIVPDLILNRGGYKEYLPLLKRFQNVPSVYIGCGRRWNPTDMYWSSWMKDIRVDCVLVDSPAQQKELLYENTFRVEVFPKPALDHIFRPVVVKKDFDIVFISHRPDDFKGGPWLASYLPDGCRILCVGVENERLREEASSGRLYVEATGKVPRRDVPAQACRGYVGVVCDDGLCDSGPRVLPEFLAMNLPVIVRSCVRADLGRYISLQSGRVVRDGKIWLTHAIQDLMINYDKLAPRAFYKKGLTLKHAAARMVGLFEELMNGL